MILGVDVLAAATARADGLAAGEAGVFVVGVVAPVVDGATEGVSEPTTEAAGLAASGELEIDSSAGAGTIQLELGLPGAAEAPGPDEACGIVGATETEQAAKMSGRTPNVSQVDRRGSGSLNMPRY